MRTVFVRWNEVLGLVALAHEVNYHVRPLSVDWSWIGRWLGWLTAMGVVQRVVGLVVWVAVSNGTTHLKSGSLVLL